MKDSLITIIDYYDVHPERGIWKHPLKEELGKRGYWVEQRNLYSSLFECKEVPLGDLLIINPWAFTMPSTRGIYREIIKKARAKGTKILVRTCTDPEMLKLIEEQVFSGEGDYDGIIGNNAGLEEAISKIEKLLRANERASEALSVC